MSAAVQIVPDAKGLIISRTSISVSLIGDVVTFGTMRRKLGGFAYLVGLLAGSGRLLWATIVDNHPAAIITASPTMVGGFVVAGISSMEESRAGKPKYACCTFRGSVVKVSKHE